VLDILSCIVMCRVQGDYDRHLAKVNYAMDRKRAMLESLMGRASLYLLMLLLCVEEMRRLSVLSEQLGGAAGLMEGQVATIEARLQRCAQCGCGGGAVQQLRSWGKVAAEARAGVQHRGYIVWVQGGQLKPTSHRGEGEMRRLSVLSGQLGLRLS
jgi:hypothetical protein